MKPRKLAIRFAVGWASAAILACVVAAGNPSCALAADTCSVKRAPPEAFARRLACIMQRILTDVA
jgi:hypothetical protein